jgi:hypothetical protein
MLYRCTPVYIFWLPGCTDATQSGILSRCQTNNRALLICKNPNSPATWPQFLLTNPAGTMNPPPRESGRAKIGMFRRRAKMKNSGEGKGRIRHGTAIGRIKGDALIFSVPSPPDPRVYERSGRM